MSYHGIEPADLVVVHDEADFEPGIVRLKNGGGLAGHKGLVSLAAHLGTPDFLRVRIGVGRPPGGPEKLARWVLERPGKADAELLLLGVQRGADAVECLFAKGLEAAMREFHAEP
jgi:PTH1 family peptidyl-tRNA hydrolase